MLVYGSIAFVACSDGGKATKDYNDFKVYVSEHRDSAKVYYDKEWSDMEAEYNAKKMKAEEKMNDWNAEMKSDYASVQQDWDSFKEDYLAERARRENATKLEAVVDNLLPQGIETDLNNVTAENLLEVHTHFVNYVDTHKDEMTREQWDRVELMWEALGAKKNELEKDLKSADNLKIAELKIKYGAIKATNRPGAKLDEKAEAESK